MARNSRRVFTLEEKARLIAEVNRLHLSGGRGYGAITREVGISLASYYKWVAAGIKPKKAPVIYTDERRAELVKDVEELLAAGQTLKAACQVVGIGAKSFRNWRAQGQPTPPMRPVNVTALVPTVSTALTLTTATPGPALLTLVAPGGYRVEGLSVEDTATLLKALT